MQGAVIDAGVRNIKIEQCGQKIRTGDEAQGHFVRGVHPCVDEREIEFEQGARPTLLDLAEIEIELSELFGGVRVDLRTPQELSRYFRDQVVSEALVQYAA